MIMKMLLETFNDKGEITKEDICSSEADAISKIGTKKYYRVHKCYHDETPFKACILIKQKLPVIKDVIENEVSNP